MASTRVAVIINPISGTGGRLHVARDRAELAASLIASRGYDSEIFITERPGHGRELAAGLRDAKLPLGFTFVDP